MKTTFTKHFIVALVAMFSGAANAAPLRLEILATIIAKQLRPSVTTLTRDVDVFHWGDVNVPNAELVGVRDPIFKKLAIMNTSKFWTTNQLAQPGSAGFGLYAALDPISTLIYGNALTQVTLKKGDRILHSLSGLPADISLYLRYNSRTGSLLGYTDADFSHLKRLVAKKLGIVAFTYTYISHTEFSMCFLKQPETYVVVIGDGDNGDLPPERFSVLGFVKRKSRESAEARELYDRIGRWAEVSSMYSENVFYGLHSGSPTEKDIAYWREHLFYCDKKYTEDFVRRTYE
jgi:hypothetical protein